MSAIIALIGRPNVGKSSVFNLLTNTNASIVADYPGLTRDRKYGTLNNSSIVLIDTGGIGSEGDLSKLVLSQTQSAIDEADIFLLILDAKEGILPLDQEIVHKLRKTNKRIIPIINKIDAVTDFVMADEFSKLGFEEFLYISAAHNRGIKDLRDYLDESFYESEERNLISDDLTISIIGRPNVGKSTLLNTLLGNERAVVSSEAGTTRDSVEESFVHKGKKVRLIDTAGMRRKRSVKESTERSFVGKSIVAIRNSQVVIMMIDGSESMVDQDVQLISLATTLGKSIVIAINKIDLLDNENQKSIEKKISRKLSFASYIQYTFISAKHGKRIDKLLNLAHDAYRTAIQELETSELNIILRQALEKQPPVMSGRFRPKLKYAHPGGKNPPVIIIHGNNLVHLQFSYIKYLENFFRLHLDLQGSPLFIQIKDSENPYKEKKNVLTDRQKRKRQRMIKKRKK